MLRTMCSLVASANTQATARPKGPCVLTFDPSGLLPLSKLRYCGFSSVVDAEEGIALPLQQGHNELEPCSRPKLNSFAVGGTIA